jgi:outer membrane protein OmpA-like peptidoglycan-associated protein
MNAIIKYLSILFMAATPMLGGVDHNPLNNGTTLTHNALGHTFEGALHNPALLGVDRVPKAGLMFPGSMIGIGVWSDKLALSPFNRYWADSLRESSALVTKILKNSFDLEGMNADEVSNKLTKEFKDGINVYTGYKQSIVNLGWNRIAFDVSTHFDEETKIPEGPLMMIFSNTDGLLPGNTLDFSTLHEEGIWATDFTLSFGLPVTIPALHDLLKLRYGAGGISVKYVMGHSAFKATADRGTVYFNDTKNEISVDGQVKVTTAGSGFHGDWKYDNMFAHGLPVSGHGFGMDLGGILYDEHGTLTVNFNNLGALFWTSGVKEVTYKIKKDDLDAYDIIKGIDDAHNDLDSANIYIFGKPSEEISDESDTLKDADGFTTLLPMALNIGYSYSWDFSRMPMKYRLLAEYAHAAINYEQSLVKTPGRTLIPRFSIGGEAGALRGFLPLRLGYVFGGSEIIASALGAGINFKYVSLNASYKAIGHPFFIPKRGVELAVGLNISWGMNSDQDKDSILDKDDQCRTVPEDRDKFEDSDGCPDFDNDKDGIPDTLDKCINDPEDKDGFEDTDGCPDLDNDKDSITDSLDKCPLQAEDKDDFEDTDGCPDFDNDGDHVADSSDKCPNNAEDIDGFEDADGCPDFDNDADNIPDSVDSCMMAPEVFNGYKDEDGCPDTLIRPSEEDTKKLITKLKAINFKTGSAELLPASFTALNFIADFLNNYGTLRYEIQGHTDSQGSDQTNLLLSAARAGTVRNYLISKGIPEARLIGIGYGETMPIADNLKAQGRAQNRRVEFKIIETNDEYSMLKTRETEFQEKVRAAKIKGVK